MSFGQKRAYPGAYDCDGKTTMDLLNNDKDFGLMINSYSQMGFRLNNNVFVLGPMAIFPKYDILRFDVTPLMWDFPFSEPFFRGTSITCMT